MMTLSSDHETDKKGLFELLVETVKHSLMIPSFVLLVVFLDSSVALMCLQSPLKPQSQTRHSLWN